MCDPCHPEGGDEDGRAQPGLALGRDFPDPDRLSQQDVPVPLGLGQEGLQSPPWGPGLNFYFRPALQSGRPSCLSLPVPVQLCLSVCLSLSPWRSARAPSQPPVPCRAAAQSRNSSPGWKLPRPWHRPTASVFPGLRSREAPPPPAGRGPGWGPPGLGRAAGSAATSDTQKHTVGVCVG